MGATKASQTRLYVIQARNAPTAVIFRRGPSNNVLLIKWNTADDTFEYGQWFKGRIYERRCDLSPDGELLLYFAAKYKAPLRSWSAISRPPYLKALALWPKGDGWGGGGQFNRHDQISLNHRENEMGLADGFSLPKGLKVKQFGDRPGWGEDDPICSSMLQRDGWELISGPTKYEYDFDADIVWDFDSPLRWRKRHPKLPKRYEIERSIVGIKKRDGPWYLTKHSLVSEGVPNEFGSSEWADWLHNGNLVFSKEGSLYRVRLTKSGLSNFKDAVCIADFSKLKFENREAPNEYERWPKRKR